MSRRKRKLEIDNDDTLHDLSSDDNSTNHNKSNHSYPPKKRVKFDESVNADSSNDKYNKYESSSIHFPKLSNYLKVRVGDNQDLKDICYKKQKNINDSDNNNEAIINNHKQLWLFHFPPGFDESSIHNLKISIPKQPKSGQRIHSFIINKRRFQIIEYDCSQNNIVNLFPIDHKLKLGQPFSRHFHILPDLRALKHKTNKYIEMRNIHHSEEDDAMLFNNSETETVKNTEKRKSKKKKKKNRQKLSESDSKHDSQKKSKRKSKKKKKSSKSKKHSKQE